MLITKNKVTIKILKTKKKNQIFNIEKHYFNYSTEIVAKNL